MNDNEIKYAFTNQCFINKISVQKYLSSVYQMRSSYAREWSAKRIILRANKYINACTVHNLILYRYEIDFKRKQFQ